MITIVNWEQWENTKNDDALFPFGNFQKMYSMPYAILLIIHEIKTRLGWKEV